MSLTSVFSGSGQATRLTAAATFALAALTPSPVAAGQTLLQCQEPATVPLFVDSTLGDRFAQAVDRLCPLMAADSNVDQSIVLHLLARGEDAELKAVLPDGRTAVRAIRVPEELALAVSALVTIPPLNAPEPAREPVPVAIDPSPLRDDSRSEHHLGFELGASTSLRLAGSPMLWGPSLGAYAALVPGNWLWALTLRWDPVQIPARAYTNGLEMDAAGAGFALLRRVGSGGTKLDAGVSAALLLETQSYEGSDGEHAETVPDVRLGLVTRVSFGKSNPRWTGSLDVDVSPARLRRNVRIDESLPSLPSWEVGAGLGTSWGQP